MFDRNLSQLSIPLPDNTDVVNAMIKVDGSEISQEVEILSIEVERSFNRVASARLVILDGGVADQRFPTSDEDTFSPGNEIEIEAGYQSERDTIFKGLIIKHAIRVDQTGRPQLHIECKDKAVKMTVGRKNNYFFDSTDSSVIEEIAGSHNLNTDVESTSVNHSELVQYYCSDWDFVLSRAESNGLLVLTQDGEFMAKAPDFNQSPEFTITYGTSLYEFEAEMDARNQYPEAKSKAWDPATQGLLEFTSSSLGNGPGSDLASLGSGVAPNRSAPNTDYTQVTGISDFLVQHSGSLSQEELQALAEAQYLKSSLSKSRGWAKITGLATAKPGITVSLQGLGARHSGSVYITSIRHQIQQGSWYTHVQFGLSPTWFAELFDDIQDKAAAKLLPGVNGLQIGKVTKLENDPDGEFRIQVRLPMVDDSSDGIWARIILQDAGNNRSATFLPEIDDEVIVGFINDDPRDAIVLGMVHSSAFPSPFTAADNNHIKGWHTRSEMKMLFDDEKSSWTLETPAGKKIIIDDDADSSVLEDQHGNKITMDSNGITIETPNKLTLSAQGDVEVSGTNITQEANAAMSSKGSASAEISSSGETVVKGSMVRIN